MTERYDDTCLPQDLRRLGELRQLRSHRDLTHRGGGSVQQSFDEVGIGVAKKVGIVGSAVLAGEERALEVDSQNRGVAPALSRRDTNLGNENAWRSRDQREQLTSNAVLAVQPPRRTNGLGAFAVRDAGTAVVVDVDQPWGKDVARAVDDIVPSRRAVVRMYLGGYAREEIATLMGWSEAKTRNLLYRGLADLRERLVTMGVTWKTTA